MFAFFVPNFDLEKNLPLIPSLACFLQQVLNGISDAAPQKQCSDLPNSKELGLLSSSGIQTLLAQFMPLIKGSLPTPTSTRGVCQKFSLERAGIITHRKSTSFRVRISWSLLTQAGEKP